MSENDERERSGNERDGSSRNERDGSSAPDNPAATRQVSIPERTAERVEARIDGTEFESVDDYVSFALELLLRQLASRDEPVGGPDPDEPTESDEVRDRLEQLGYL